MFSYFKKKPPPIDPSHEAKKESAAALISDPEYQKAVVEFVGAFEVVFHHDWEYAKTMIGDEEEGCTFLEPGLEDEVDDWGARGALLEKFRHLRELMKERKIEPQFPYPLERVRKFKGRSR